MFKMVCRKRWSYYKKIKLGSRFDCSRKRRLNSTNGFTGRKNHQRKLCGQEDW
jgi:hypothetical protein